MSINNITIFILIVILSPFVVVQSKYTPDWASIDSRPIPNWYDEAKFGIFMHWGVFSYIGLADAWFVWRWKNASSPEEVNYMKDNYSPRFTYADFASRLKADLYDPNYFANLVKSSGAKYYVLTSKHCEGYTMWPSKYSWNWNAKDVGPDRDIVGEMAEAFRNKAPGVKFGLYYCLLEWFNPLYMSDKKEDFTTSEYPEAHTLPQVKELINKYQPDLLWSDGAWEAPISYWKSLDFLAWLYNESPVKDKIVTNDRWGIGAQCRHGGYYNCYDKYNPGTLQSHKWENAMTTDNYSWGFRRNAKIEDFNSIQQLLATFAKTISCGGNMLMNVGPTPDGRVQPAFEERLLQMGQWLATNGEAVYASKPWIYQLDPVNHHVWYTSKLKPGIADTLNLPANRLHNPQLANSTIAYAITLQWPTDGKLTLGAPNSTATTSVTLIGYPGMIKSKALGGPDASNGGIVIDLTQIDWWKLPNTWAWVFKLENLADDNRKPVIAEPRMDVNRGEEIMNHFT